MTDISKKLFIWGIAMIVILRIILLALAINNIPFTDIQPDWRPNFQGTYQPDEIVFFNLAKSLADFKPIPSIVYIGHAFFLAPFIYFTGAANIDAAIKPLIIIQGILLYIAAILFVALIGLKFFRNRKLALISAFIYLVYPYLLFGFFKVFNPKSAFAVFHYQLWIFMLSDYLSAFMVLLAFWLAIKLVERFKNPEGNILRGAALLGLVSGLTALVRPPNVAIPAFLFLFLVYHKRIKISLIFGFSTFAAYLPQLIYNTYFFGKPWLFGNAILNTGSSQAFLRNNWAFSNYWLNFSYYSPHYYLWLFFAALLFVAAIFTFGMRHIYKTDKKLVPIFAFWFLFYLLFYGSFGGSLSQLRYFLPLIPVFIYFLVASCSYLYEKA